jgi:lipid-binding SYLF domain-containing protein
MWKKILISLLLVTLAHSPAAPILAIDRPGALERLNDCTEILSEFIHIPEESIPSKLLKSCEALVIIPHVVKAALIVGGRRGHGVMIHRLPDDTWSSPSFVTITGGSVGLQLGGQALDLVLVVNNKRGYEALMEDNFKFGVNASAAAGPVGRNMEAGTDIKLKAEIYAYARSKGLFAGISLDGAALTIDHDANTAFYGRAVDYKAVLNDPAWHFPPEAKPLIDKIEGYIGEE